MENQPAFFETTFKLGEAPYPQPRIATMLSVGDNFMPLSWHMPVSKSPFRYAVAIREENYSHQLVKKYREFALNFLNYTYYQTYADAGAVHGDQVDKFALTGLTKKEAEFIQAPLIEEAYMIYECRLFDIQRFGDHDLFIADVLAVHSRQEEFHQSTLFLGRGHYETTTGNPIQASRE